ncbi:MAG: hypothetical protein ACXAD7_20090 [Candidatus Kariarchaeaceae archaeon]|jgi:predicted aspartyl protease
MISFDYETIENTSSKAPFLKFSLADPLEKKSIILKGLVDTGYDGELLLSNTSYRELALRSFEVPVSDLIVGETVTGERLSIQNSSAILEIAGIDVSILVEVDTFKGCKEILIGRKFLKSFLTTLHGQSEKLSFTFLEED